MIPKNFALRVICDRAGQMTTHHLYEIELRSLSYCDIVLIM